MRHKDTIELYRYWDGLRAGRPAPDRAEISPAALGRLLPSVMLIERKSDGDTTLRLAGSRLCALRCRELRGEQLASMFVPVDRRNIQRIVSSVHGGGTVAVLDIEARTNDGRTVEMEIALFPLTGTKAQALGIASFASLPVWLGTDPVELDLRGIRMIDPDADLIFLQNRPSVPLASPENRRGERTRGGLNVVFGGGREADPRRSHPFTVYDGGKK
jgi:hypothetical protein